MGGGGGTEFNPWALLPGPNPLPLGATIPCALAHDPSIIDHVPFSGRLNPGYITWLQVVFGPRDFEVHAGRARGKKWRENIKIKVSHSLGCANNNN